MEPDPAIVISRAGSSDFDQIVDLVAAFYREDGHPFDEHVVREAVRPLLVGNGPGFILIAISGEEAVGYAVVTWGYALESGGRDALLDEIYSARAGAGIGSALMGAVFDAARQGGARRMFLETERPNDGARRFYSRHGFDEDDSIWMSRDL